MKKLSITQSLNVITRTLGLMALLLLVTPLQAQHQGHMVINDHRGKPVKILKPDDATVEWEVRYNPKLPY